jgi:pimeloyl-ACP methyl ester carboxylesterase
VAQLLGRPAQGDGIEKLQVSFGAYLAGDVYLPAGLSSSGRKAPCILYLHPFSYAGGYVMPYRRGDQLYRTLARAGYVVFCFDQIGFGRRIQEGAGFATRYRAGLEWSLLGKMVRDAQAALDAMQALPYVDARNITAVGYSLGALVGLHLAALDERVAGLASVCGPAPFRLDTDLAETGGAWRWTGLHGLAPWLAGFMGREQDLPYDVDDLLACLAPRPTLVLSPQLDREAPLDLVTRGVENARQNCLRYGIHPRLCQISPETYNQLGPEVQQIVLDWLGKPGSDG